MEKGNINAALNILTNNMSHGILPLDQKTISQVVLKQKSCTSEDILINWSLEKVHPVRFESINEELIRKAAIKTKAGIFPNTFIQPVNGSKNSILNELWNSISSCFFFCFFFEKPLKCFPFYSPILQKRIKESCMYLSSQLFFETPNKTPKFQEKSESETRSEQKVSEMHFLASGDLNFKNFPFGAYHDGGNSRR